MLEQPRLAETLGLAVRTIAGKLDIPDRSRAEDVVMLARAHQELAEPARGLMPRKEHPQSVKSFHREEQSEQSQRHDAVAGDEFDEHRSPSAEVLISLLGDHFSASGLGFASVSVSPVMIKR